MGFYQQDIILQTGYITGRGNIDKISDVDEFLHGGSLYTSSRMVATAPAETIHSRNGLM